MLNYIRIMKNSLSVILLLIGYMRNVIIVTKRKYSEKSHAIETLINLSVSNLPGIGLVVNLKVGKGSPNDY